MGLEQPAKIFVAKAIFNTRPELSTQNAFINATSDDTFVVALNSLLWVKEKSSKTTVGCEKQKTTRVPVEATDWMKTSTIETGGYNVA
jgi:hypothetical protein